MLLRFVFGLAIGCMLILGAGCGGDNPAEPEPTPTISVSLSDQIIHAGDTGSLSIALNDIDASVFAMSMRIEYAPAVLVIREQDAYGPGVYFGTDALALLQVDDGIMYLAITRIASKSADKNSGLVGEIAFNAQQNGQCDFIVNIDDVRFIDANGQNVEIPDLAIRETTLTVE